MDCVVDGGIAHQAGNIGIVTRNENILQLHEHGRAHSLEKGDAQKQGVNWRGESDRAVYLSFSFETSALNDLIVHKPTGRVCVHFVNLQELSLVVYVIAFLAYLSS